MLLLYYHYTSHGSTYRWYKLYSIITSCVTFYNHCPKRVNENAYLPSSPVLSESLMTNQKFLQEISYKCAIIENISSPYCRTIVFDNICFGFLEQTITSNFKEE